MKLVKKLGLCLLAILMMLCVTACGTVKKTENTADLESTENTENTGNKDSAAEDTEEESVLTLDNTEVELVYAEGSYLLLAYHGPQGNTGMHYCNGDGTDFDFEPPHPEFWNFDNGWRLIKTDELPEGIDASSVGLSVTDYSREDEPNRVFANFDTSVSDEKLKEIGVCFFNGLAGNVSSYASAYKEDITIVAEFCWWGDARKTRMDQWTFTTDDFEFFISDGTPLKEAYGEYEMQIETYNIGGGQIWVTLTRGEETTDEDAKELIAKEPYAIFTANDGSTVKIELLDKY